MAEGSLFSVWRGRSRTRVVGHPPTHLPSCLIFTFILLAEFQGIACFLAPPITSNAPINVTAPHSIPSIDRLNSSLGNTSTSPDQILSSLVDFLWSSNSNSSVGKHVSTFEDDLADFVSKYQQPKVSVSPSVSVSVSTSTRIFTRSSSTSSSSSAQRKRQRQQQTGFQDIISGLVKLLGGKNVHVANHSDDVGQGQKAPVDIPSRTNNRAPPKFTQITSASSANAFKSQASIENVQLSTSFSTIDSSTETIAPVDASTAPLPSGPITEWAPAFQASTSKETESVTATEVTFASSSTENARIKPTQTSSTHKWSSTSQTEVDYAAKTDVKPETLYAQPSTKSTQNVQLPSKSADDFPVFTKSTDSFQVFTKSTDNFQVFTKSTDSFQVFTKPTDNFQAFTKSTDSFKPTDNLQLSTQSTSIKTSVVPSVSTSHTVRIQPTAAVKRGSVGNVGPTGSPFIIPVDIEQIRLLGSSGNEAPKISSEQTDESVFINGKKTYFDLNPPPAQTETAVASRPGGDTTLVNVGVGYSFPIAEGENAPNKGAHSGSVSNVQLKQNQWPSTPPRPGPNVIKAGPTNARPLLINKNQVRIDTCIIGDESACNGDLNETCRVESGVSSCYCRLGYGRNELQEPQTGCKLVSSLVVYIRVDRVNNEQLVFGPDYQNPSSSKYQILESEAKIALDSVFQMSSLSADYSASQINSFFSVGTKLIVNATVHLLTKPSLDDSNLPQHIRQSLIKVLQQRQQAIGHSRLFVDGPLNPIPGVQDLDECADEMLNDCSKFATCENIFGSFRCSCFKGYIDKYPDDQSKSGRNCAVCSSAYCTNRGDCIVNADGDKECRCHGNFIGSKCETDAEVLGVSLGASLAALVIIVLTLVCLCMWSRRWKRDQQKMSGNNYNYFNKPSANNLNDRSNDYHHSSNPADHLRWSSASSDLFHDNFYAQPETLMAKPPHGYPPNRPPPLPNCPPPLAPSVQGQKHLHKTLQPLRSLPSPLTTSRSNIMDDTDEEFDSFAGGATYERFQYNKNKPNRTNANPMNNIYYDVNFGNNFNGGGSNQHDFPLKNMRAYYS